MALNIFSLVGSIMVDSDEANKSIQKTGDNAKSLASKLGSGLKTVGKAAAGIATVAAGAATAAGAAIYSLSNDAAAVGDNVDKMSQKIGISRQAYQELDFICSQSGTSVDNLKAGLKTLTAVMDTTKAGTSKTKTALEELGIAATDSNGNFRDNEEVMWEAFEALSKLENQTEKERLAVELFGKAGSELLPMLNGTTEGIQAMREQAHELGLVMTDEAIDSAVKYTDTMDQLQRSFKAAKTSLGTAVLPIIHKFAAKVLDFMPKIKDFIGKLTPPLEKITGTLLDTLGELMDKVLPPLLDLATALIEPASKLIESVMPVLVKLLDKATPILLEIVQELLPPLLDILDAFMPILDIALELLDPILDLVKAIIKPLGEVLKAVEPLISKGVELVNEALEPFKGEIGEISKGLETVLGPALEFITDLIGAVRAAKLLPYNVCCWNCGNGKNGSYNFSPAYIQFEVCEDGLTDKAYFEEAFALAARLAASLAKSYKIPLENIISHTEAHARGYASNHGDPENWLGKFGRDMDWFRALVANGGKLEEQVLVTATKKISSKDITATVLQLKSLGFDVTTSI